LCFGAKKKEMASALEKDRGSNDVRDEKLEAQDHGYLDGVQTNANDPIPDPDAGLSSEERAAIVSCDTFSSRFTLSNPNPRTANCFGSWIGI
jgi:hypothetical protein